MQPSRPAEQKNPNVDNTPVKEIVESTISLPNALSVQAALNEMRAQGAQASPVTEPDGKLLGSVCETKINRQVGGRGHDPKTEPVEPQIDKNAAHCCEDQPIADAEKMMREANVEEVSVVNRDKILVGKATLIAVEGAQRRRSDDNATTNN